MKRITSILFVVLLIGIWIKTYAGAAPYFEGTEEQKNAAIDMSTINDDFTVNPDFTSHLPLIVIDTHGQEIEKLTEYVIDDDGNVLPYREPIEGVKPFVLADLYIYDNSDNSLNSLLSTEYDTVTMRIHKHGNTSMDFEKGNYKINLITETGQEKKIPLLGMDSEDEFILVGTQLDRSLMRNLLSYTAAKEIMPFTPDAKYCELLFKNGDIYEYCGVYLLVENIKQGQERVNIITDAPNSLMNGFIIRRDRISPYEARLNTWATEIDSTNGVFNLEYPDPETASEETVAYIEARLSEIERVLYSDDPSVFLTYPDYIDEASFVDYFLINEYFCNYDANFNSTYFYLNSENKLAAGPVWDFDGILDNYRSVLYEPKKTSFQSAPWFDRLILSEEFINKLLDRYSE